MLAEDLQDGCGVYIVNYTDYRDYRDYRDYVGVILGLLGIYLGLYRGDGKENGNYSLWVILNVMTPFGSDYKYGIYNLGGIELGS